MMGIECTQGTVGDVVRNSYDRYAMAAQFRNAVIREQLQTIQDFVAISDKLLRLPFPGLMATDRSSEIYKDLAVQMQNVVAEHSSSTLELWASMFGYQGTADHGPARPKAAAQKKTTKQTASKAATAKGRKPAKTNGGKAATRNAQSPKA